MRCDNCGWDNPDGTALCVKCNNVLQAAPSIPKNDLPAFEFPQKGGGTAGSSAFGGTIVDAAGGVGGAVGGSAAGASAGAAASPGLGDTDKDVLVPCPNPGCGYPNSKYVKNCVRCKTPLTAGVAAAASAPAAGTIPDRNYLGKSGVGTGAVAGTIDPYRMKIDGPPTCQLKLVPREGELLNGDNAEKGFVAGDTPIPLNRGNLDANNNSITSKVQAELVFEDGKWLLSDRSELKTTFIRVDEKVQLKDGDIIIMGDRKFIFSSSND